MLMQSNVSPAQEPKKELASSKRTCEERGHSGGAGCFPKRLLARAATGMNLSTSCHTHVHTDIKGTMLHTRACEAAAFSLTPLFIPHAFSRLLDMSGAILGHPANKGKRGPCPSRLRVPGGGKVDEKQLIRNTWRMTFQVVPEIFIYRKIKQVRRVVPSWEGLPTPQGTRENVWRRCLIIITFRGWVLLCIS